MKSDVRSIISVQIEIDPAGWSFMLATTIHHASRNVMPYYIVILRYVVCPLAKVMQR